MKNIAIIIASLKTGGGAENVVSQLSFELNKPPYKLHILTFYDAEQERPYSGHRESLHEDLDEWKIKKLFYRAHKIKQFCKNHNIETAISFMPEASYPLVISRILFGNKIKIILSERNNPNHKPITYRITTRFLYPHADKIIAVTKKLAAILQKKYKAKNVYTIYNPFDIEKNSQLQKAPLPATYKHVFNEKNFIFITVGRLVPVKNHAGLIESFKEVAQNHPQAKLVILGEGILRKQLEDLIASLKLKNNVFLLGNQDNVFPFLKASQCFVFSSLHEGFPNALLEALSANIPVISTDCETGPREIIAPEITIEDNIKYPYSGKYGTITNVLKNKKSKNLFSKSMLSIIENKKNRKKHSSNAKWTQDFNIQTIAEKWKNILG